MKVRVGIVGIEINTNETKWKLNTLLLSGYSFVRNSTVSSSAVALNSFHCSTLLFSVYIFFLCYLYYISSSINFCLSLALSNFLKKPCASDIEVHTYIQDI